MINTANRFRCHISFISRLLIFHTILVLLLLTIPNIAKHNTLYAAPLGQAEEVDCVLYPASITPNNGQLDGLPFAGSGVVATSSVYVPNELDRAISDVNVYLSIDHLQLASDVVVKLSSDIVGSPAGALTIFDGPSLGSVSSPGNVFLNGVIDDDAPRSLTAATILPYQQSYRPHGGSLANDFGGLRGSGTWQLDVSDATADSNSGQLIGWSLEVCYQTPPTILQVNKNVISTDIHAGTTVQFEVIIINSGTYTAYDADLADNLLLPSPTGGQIVEVEISNNNFGYAPTGDECSDHGFCNLPDIPPDGNFVAVRSTIQIDPDQGGNTLENQTCVESDNADIICGSESVAILSDAALSVKKTTLVSPIIVHDTNTAQPSDDGAYSIIVQNNGNSDASSVIVIDTLPTNMVVSNDPTINPSYDASVFGAACTGFNTGTLNCNLGTLPAGQSVEIYVPVGFSDHSAVCGQTLVNDVTVTYSDDVDGAVTLDASAVVAVQCESDVELLQSGPASITSLGTEYDYTLSIVNSGQSPIVAGVLQVTDFLPPELIYKGITNPSSCGFSTGTALDAPGPTDLIFTNSSELDVGDTCDLILRVQLRDDDPTLCQDGLIFNRAEATVNLTPFDTDQATYLTKFSCQSDLNITATGPTQVVPGQTGTYVVRVENLGPDPACDIVLENIPFNFDATLATLSGDFGEYAASTHTFHRLSCMEPGQSNVDSLTFDLYFPPDSQKLQAAQGLAYCASGTLSTPNTTDPDTTNNALPNNPSTDTDQCVQFEYTPTADLKITKRAFVEKAGVGDLIQYNFDVYNPGPSDVIIDPNTAQPDMFFGIDDLLTGPADLIAVNSGSCD